jgi:hypothetical protein
MVFLVETEVYGTLLIFQKQNQFALKQNKFASFRNKWPETITNISLDKLIEHKDGMFTFLKQSWQDLFNAEFDVLLYDLTSTYFECDHPESGKRRFGYRGEQNSSKGAFPIPHDPAMTVNQVMNEWRPAGFELVTSVEFLPIQHFFVFKNADDKTRPAIRALTIENTPNVSTFDHKIYFAGQPDGEALKQFAGFGVKTVISLRGDRELADLSFDE